MIKGLHHIAILVSDRTASLRFYETLGFTLRESHIRTGRKDEILLLDGHGITLELFAVKDRPARVTDPEAYGLRHPALLVDDVDETVRQIKAVGYTPEPIRLDSFTGEKMTFVKDPDGLPVELHE